MLKNYITTTVRSLLRNKVNTVINIAGLAMGISCALVLFLLAEYSNSFNKFEKNYDAIHRLVYSSKGQGGQTDYNPGVPLPLPEALKLDFPEFEEVVLVRNYEGEKMFAVNPSSDAPIYFELQDEQIALTDNNYFKTFTNEWLAGDNDKVLKTPGSTVISKSVAELLFPNGNALGQILLLNKETELTIEGIVADPPSNSDMPFQVFIANETQRKQINDSHWRSLSSDDQCYILLSEDNIQTNFRDRLAQFIVKHFDENDNESEYHLQPMSDLHFNENWSNFNYSTTSKNEIMIMVLIGIFLLITACINFVNLSTAVAIRRSREVGVRKVLGGTRNQLIFQFMAESFAIVAFSIMIALGLAELMIININPFLEVDLSINLLEVEFLAYLLAGAIIITLLAGFYPSLVLSGFKPALALKGKITTKNSGRISLRKGLVVFQFFISQLFIIGTIITLSQMDYIRNVDLGFDSEALIHIRIPEQDISKQKVLRTEVERLSGVNNISLNFSPPSSGSVSVSNFSFDDNPEEFYTSMKFADENYLETYEIELLAGRKLNPSDTINEVIVNEKLLKYVGFTGAYEEAIGKQFKVRGGFVPIVGVIRDFHSVSLHDDIMTIALFSSARNYRIASIKVNMNSFSDTNGQIKDIWKALYPEYDYNYEFYDDQLAEHYEGEQKMATIFSFFSIIAIVVGCMGLFGLASFMINQKIKEIGVRKTLGASVPNIVGMFSISFLKLILLSFILAVPLSWYAMDQWLQNFQYRIELSPVLFSVGLLATLIVAGLTVGYKSIKAALVNPVESLRSE